MIKVSTGFYAEIISAVIEYDGDYLQGTVKVKVVSNGMDNIHEIQHPDCYGEFVQDIPSETVKNELVPKVEYALRIGLKASYKFTDAELKNLHFKYSFTK